VCSWRQRHEHLHAEHWAISTTYSCLLLHCGNFKIAGTRGIDLSRSLFSFWHGSAPTVELGIEPKRCDIRCTLSVLFLP
jgi:hypothetical protein